MRFVVQRVSAASVEVENKIVGKIDKGFLVLIGVSDEDLASDIPGAKEIADKMVKKLLNLRIFDDADGKTNLDLNAVGGNVLLISQFTLYADCKKGNRPSFVKAGAPKPAEEIYEYIIAKCREELGDERVECGVFGAEMKVSLVNDGPFTILLDSAEIL